MTTLEIFFFIQLLDFLTTLVGFHLGGSEISPFIRMVLHLVGPVLGLAAVKLLGFGMAAVCTCTHRQRVLSWVNYFFAAVVVWNMSQILRAVSLFG